MGVHTPPPPHPPHLTHTPTRNALSENATQTHSEQNNTKVVSVLFRIIR